MIDTKTLRTVSEALKANLAWERFRPEFEAWERSLPDQFVLAGCAGHAGCPVHQKPLEPMVFVRDPTIPGLYRCSL